MNDEIKKIRCFDGQDIEVIYRKTKPLTDPSVRYPGFHPGQTVLAKGSAKRQGALPLPCDILFEQDIEIKLRDGTKIFADVFKPVGEKNLPAIVAWTPYGKQTGTVALDDIPMRAGVPAGAVSGWQTWEGPDPAYWCARGYAVVNVDCRGAYGSDGDMPFWGRQEAQDASDLIEWAASQTWCNGKVGMSGNSWLALIQWFVAAENPPHLAAIAPWEGATDLYREDIARGGIINYEFNENSISRQPGKSLVEDIPAMIRKYPLMNAFWEDKRARLEKVAVPAYVVGSWTHPMHTPGSMHGYSGIASKDKWLRVHNSAEWPDYYQPENVDDLRKFFDYYLKGLKNDWEKTPKVRLAVLDPECTDVVNRPENEFPLGRTRYKKIFLDASSGGLNYEKPKEESQFKYMAGDGKGMMVLKYKFERDTELTGYFKLKLWVQAEGSDDMDLYVLIQKLNTKGMVVPILNVPAKDSEKRKLLLELSRRSPGQMGLMLSMGVTGKLRISHREIDEKLSKPYEPYLPHRGEQLLKPGEIVPVEIAINPLGMFWHKDEYLELSISGFPRFVIASALPSQAGSLVQQAKGEHIIHTGGKYDSHLLIPFISG